MPRESIDTLKLITELLQRIGKLKPRSARSLMAALEQVHIETQIIGEPSEALAAYTSRTFNLNELDVIDGLRGFLASEKNLECLTSEALEAYADDPEDVLRHRLRGLGEPRR